MAKAPIILSCLIALSLIGQAQSQSAKRAGAGVGAALSEWADRQAALNAEIELARTKAAIEIDTQRKLQALRAGQSPEPTSEPEEAKLGRRHPQWVRIITSTAFNNFLNAAPLSYAQTCRNTSKGVVLAQCIDDFFGPPVQLGPAR